MDIDWVAVMKLHREISNEYFWNDLNRQIDLIIELNNRQIENRCKFMNNKLESRLNTIHLQVKHELLINYTLSFKSQSKSFYNIKYIKYGCK